MYSKKTVERNVERTEAKLGITLHRYEPWQSADLTDYLVRRHAEGKLLDSNGSFIRRIDADFVRNERILCGIDFTYFTRYCQIIRDATVGGGLGALDLWESQEILLDLVGRTEEANVEQ